MNSIDNLYSSVSLSGGGEREREGGSSERSQTGEQVNRRNKRDFYHELSPGEIAQHIGANIDPRFTAGSGGGSVSGGCNGGCHDPVRRREW